MAAKGTIEVVGAIRLAFAGAANDETALKLIHWLVDQAPPTPFKDTASVQLFIDGIKAIGGSVTTESPSGAYEPAERP